MRQIIRIMGLAGLLLALSSGGVPMLHAQRAASKNIVLTFQISPQTKVLDLGQNGSTPPANWTGVDFDDSSWQSATQVTDTGCLTDYGWPSTPPTYWGDTQQDSYAFRFTFGLPAAKDYVGSILDGRAYRAANGIYLNGQNLNTDLSGGWRGEVGASLHAGRNILAIQAWPLGGCGGLIFSLTIRANGIAISPPPTPPHGMSLLLPSQNAIVAGTTIPFSWRRFPDAAYYYLQIWLTQPASDQTITVRSVTTFSTRLKGTHDDLNARLMPKGTYHWRMIAVDAHGKTISAWTPERVVTLE